MFRKVIGKVCKTDDTPWLNTFITFKRTSGSYLNNIQYPPDVVRAKTDSQGNICKLDNSLGIDLWVNETGEKISNYQCLLPNDSFNFSVPIGDGSPIQLSLLRAGSQSVEEYPQSVIDYIDAKVENAITPIDFHYQVFIPTNNQNTFTLSSIPTVPSKTRVYLNGLKQRFGVDYNINSSILNWFDIPLISSYILEVYF